MIFSNHADLLSFSADMKETLYLPAGCDGKVWHYSHSGHVRRTHRHDELEVNLVVRGHASYLIDDRKYILQRNTQIWLFPDQEHLLLNESRDYEMWILVFKPELLKRVCSTVETRMLVETKPPAYFCKPLLEYQAARLRVLFEDILSAETDSALFNAGISYGLLSAWAAQSSGGQISPSFDIHPAVEKAARLIHNETELTGVGEIARRSGLSASRLSRIFKAQTGVSLVDYRNKQRLLRFKRIYGQGRQKNMLEAALEAGFGSYPQFHRVFKAIMGCGPAEHRRGRRGS